MLFFCMRTVLVHEPDNCFAMLRFCRATTVPSAVRMLKILLHFLIMQVHTELNVIMQMPKCNDLSSLVETDLGSTAESLPPGIIISTTSACTECSCTQPSTTDLSCLEPITNTQHSSSLLNAPVSSLFWRTDFTLTTLNVIQRYADTNLMWR